jgi:hypothetical protein
MVKNPEWQEAKAFATDNDGDKHETTIEYYEASEDTVGNEIPTLTGVHRLAPGEVVVKNPGDNQGRHDVLTKDQWNATEYGSGGNKETESKQPSQSTVPPAKQPNK